MTSSPGPAPRPPGLPALAPFGTTIFATMSALAAEHGAINLGQGFPDTDGPPEVLEAAVAAIRGGRNQYPPGAGVPELLDAVAAHQKRFYGLEVDPLTEVLVTVGATEAIAATVLALVQPGDEVVTFEPYYDSYAATIALAGGVRRTSVLRFPDFAVDEASLRAAFSSRTRMVLLNTPHNPTGKVFTRAELELVCSLAREHDAWVVTDEVYEHLVFDGAEHVPVATLPGMRERTLTISSAGKTFSTTGWKVGWVSGPAAAVAAVRAVKQFLTYVGSGPFQPAVAVGLSLPDAVYTGFAASLSGKRDRLVAGLRRAGMEVSVPRGTYFVVADAAPLGA
ncbi:MAG: aminotransferase class I/II-fold pyridoxal phosphate-dependent enzyme, partial [Ornithinibacter sp.]